MQNYMPPESAGQAVNPVMGFISRIHINPCQSDAGAGERPLGWRVARAQAVAGWKGKTPTGLRVLYTSSQPLN